MEKTKNNCDQLTCTLSTPEFQKRKTEVLKVLAAKILEKKEFENGFSFRFSGSDEMLDKLLDFIKTERECCSFFSFTLSVPSQSDVWLNITGPQNAKDFITTELEW